MFKRDDIRGDGKELGQKNQRGQSRKACGTAQACRMVYRGSSSRELYRLGINREGCDCRR